MVDYLRSKNVAEIIEMFTNGSKLNPELNTSLIAAGLQRINISLEGLTDQRYMEVAGARVDVAELIQNITHLFEKSGDCKVYIKIADQTSALAKDDDRIFVLSEDERRYFFETFGNICDEIYVEKVVPQWPRTQFDKQNDVEATGMYGQDIKKYKKICPFTFMYLQFNWDGTTSPCTLDWAK